MSSHHSSLKPTIKTRKLSLKQAPVVHFQKQNLSNYSNLISHRQRLSLKSHQSNKQTLINSVPMINSVALTPKHHQPSVSPPQEIETIRDELLIKMDNYLLVTNVLIEEAQTAHTSSDSLLKEIKKLRQGIIVLIQKQKSRGNSAMKKQKQTKNSQTNKLIQKIRSLQLQNSNLCQLISKQQQANFQLMIQMNDSQSNGMEYFKQRLEESYKSYKNLEDRVEGYQSQLQQMKNIKELIEQENQNKSRTIECLQQKIKRNSLVVMGKGKEQKERQTKQVKQLKNKQDKEVKFLQVREMRACSKRRTMNNQTVSFEMIKERIKNDILMPPFKANIKKHPYTSPFEDDYLRCIRGEERQVSLENFISE